METLFNAKKSRALRYLLLSRMNAHRKSIPSSILKEVAGSLVVRKDNENYHVKWTKGDKEYFKTYPDSTFSFYSKQKTERGDLNRQASDEFVREVFGGVLLFDRQSKWNYTSHIIRLAVYLCYFCIMLFVGGGGEVVPSVSALALLGLADFVGHRHNILSVLATFSFFVVSLPYVGVLVSITYLILNWLENNKRYYQFNIFCSLCMLIGYGVVIINAGLQSWAFYELVVFFLGSSVMLIWGGLCHSHKRKFYLILPVVSFGLCLDGFVGLAMISLCFLLALNLASSIVAFFRLQRVGT